MIYQRHRLNHSSFLHDYTTKIQFNKNRVMERVNYNTIKQLKIINNRIEELQCQKNDLLKPLLTDFSHISFLYDTFKEHHTSGIQSRKDFIMLILFIYSPTTLLGGKMKKGLREQLSIVLKVNEPSIISNNAAEVVFLYNKQRSYRDEIDKLFATLENYVQKLIF